jgi:transcriptional regulator with XRE-family HTH domain
VPRPPKNIEVSKKEIGKRIRTIRHRLGMSQAKLAETLGTHFTAISQIERGLRGVTIHQAIKLARALRVSTDEILLDGSRSKKTTSLRTGRLLRRLELVEKLPPSEQKALIGHLNALLKSHGIHAHSSEG